MSVLRGALEHRGFAFIPIEFRDKNDRPAVRECLIDTAFNGVFHVPYRFYYLLTDEEPELSMERVRYGSGWQRTRRGKLLAVWFGVEREYDIFVGSPEAPEEPEEDVLIGTSLLAQCTLFIDYLSGYYILSKEETG